MNLTEWKDAILLTAGFILSIVAGLIGAKIQRKIDRYGETRPLNQLLNFGKDDLLLVFPHREEITKAILPRTSTEDFLAMNNFISALITLEWNRKIGVRDTRHHSPNARDKKRNLVIICSPKSNSFAGEFQTQLKQKGLQFFSFEPISDDIWRISDGHGEVKSKSYEQEAEYIKSGVERHLLPTMSFEDYAVITKVANPWNSENKILLLAGIRGIGTWGAAECIKKKWKQIYAQVPNTQKDIDFSALLRISYHNCDITGIEVVRVMPIK